MDYTRQQLEVLTNQPVGKLATLNVAKLELLNPEPNRIEDWTRRAELNSPQLRSLRAQFDGAREEVDKASSGHKPTLDAIAQWARS